MNLNHSAPTTRRDFIKTSAALSAALAAPAILSSKAFAKGNSNTLRIGLIGCGGRGTGAASQALNADKNVELTAMADIFPEKIQKSLATIQKAGVELGYNDRVKVTAENRFTGLDAYKKVIDNVDVVLLTTPPGFRPTQLRAAVNAGKHVFCEKPMGTDVPGVRSVIESAKIAKEKNLALVAGFCWRYDYPRREFYKRVHEGAIGEVRTIYATYYGGQVKRMHPASERPKDMGDVEWQIRNWYNFVWLSGDGYVEQCCHSVDKVAWALKDISPIKAVAVGGRQTPNYEGNIYDHMFVVYEFPNQVRAFVGQRQINNCYSENNDYLTGTEGMGIIRGWGDPVIRGKESWRYRGPKTNMYQVEHNELFASIRSGKPINDGEWMAHSTMMGIMGRTAAYTGQEVTWEDITNSQEHRVPENITWDMKLPIKPMAVPGLTKLA